MTSKISKSVLPRFLASRKDIIRRSYVLDAGQGPPILAATYENISSISLVDSDTLQAETITGKVQGEIATLRSADGYIAFSQGSNLTIVFLGNGKQKTLSIGPKFWFFFDTNYLVVVGGDDVTKLRLEPQLATVSSYSVGADNILDGQQILLQPTFLVTDPSGSGNVAVASRNSVQVWNFRKVVSQPDGTLAIGKFLLEGVVDGPFGIASLKLYNDTIAAITHSGDFLELWYLPPTAPSRAPVPSSHKIKLNSMATSLHLDDYLVILGHMDGSITLFDRVSGEQKHTASADGSRDNIAVSLKSDSRILYVDRIGHFIVSVSPDSVEVRKVPNPAARSTIKVTECKLQRAHLDQETGAVYCLSVAQEDGLTAAAGAASDLALFQPNYKDLSKRVDSPTQQGLVTQYCDISPPSEYITAKDMKKWTVMDVIAWLASLDLGQLRQIFFDADVAGRKLARMDDAQLQELGITAVGHRKRILTSLQQILSGIVIRRGSAPAAESTMQRSPSEEIKSSSISSSSSSSPKVMKPTVSDGNIKRPSRADNVVPLVMAVQEAKKLKRASSGRSNMVSSSSRRKTEVTGANRDRGATVSGDIPKLGDMTIEFQIDNSNEVVSIPIDTTESPQLSEILSQLLSELGRTDLNPDTEIAVTIPSDAGAVVLYEQAQFEDIIQQKKRSGVDTVHLIAALERSTISCATARSPRINVSMRSIQERVTLRRYPCILVDAETNKIVSVNALAVKLLRATAPRLVGQDFDATVVLASGSCGIRDKVKPGGEEPSALITWPAILQLGDGTLARTNVVLRRVHLKSGTVVFQVGLHDSETS